MTATLSMSPQVKPKAPPKPTLYNRLKADSSCRCIRQFRRQVLDVYALGNRCPSAVIRFLHARLDQGLGDPDQQEEAEMLLFLAWQQATKPGEARRIIESQASASDTSPEAVQARMSEKAAVLAARRQEQLAQDPYAHVRSALERAAAAKPAMAAATQASEPAAAAPRKRAPRGTCCPRALELPLTLILQQIRHHDEDEAAWGPMEEFPWELAIAELEELQASGPAAIGRTPAAASEVLATAAAEPIPAESAAVDLHEQVLVAAAQGDLEPEPAEPLPVQLPPDDPVPAGAASAWDALELSPRARAIAELAVALKAAPAGGECCLPASAAAEILGLLIG